MHACMCTCVYVYVCICLHACFYVHARLHARQHACVRACVSVHVYVQYMHTPKCRRWFLFPCQLVYDVQDGGGCFHLIAVNAESMSKEEREKYQIMGTELPPSQ